MPTGPAAPPTEFARMLQQRAAQEPEPVPEPAGAPVPGAMAVVAVAAALCCLVLGAARLCGLDVPLLLILAPLWGSALVVATVALAYALVEALGDAREWVRRRGR